MDYKDFISQKKQSDLHFWYRAKLEMIAFLLSKNLKSKDLKILDIGCGTGTELDVLSLYGDVEAADKEEKALAEIKNYKHKKVDLEIDSLGEEKYDLICAFDLLEHLEKDREALLNISKALKKDTLFIFSVPAIAYLYTYHDVALEHKRRYSKKEIKTKLKEAGFEIKSLFFWNTILFPLEALFRLVKNILYKLKFIEAKTDAESFSPIVNKLLFEILSIDLFLLRRNIHIPFGLSLFGVARKRIDK